jgi:hypothetical protein
MEHLLSTVEEVAAHLELRGNTEGCTFPTDGWVWCSESCSEHARCLKSVARDLREAVSKMKEEHEQEEY